MNGSARVSKLDNEHLPGRGPVNDVVAPLGIEGVADEVVPVALWLPPAIIARHRLRFSALSTLLLEEDIVDRYGGFTP